MAASGVTHPECGLEDGGYVWKNWLGGFILEKKYEVYEMNMTNSLFHKSFV